MSKNCLKSKSFDINESKKQKSKNQQKKKKSKTSFDVSTSKLIQRYQTMVDGPIPKQKWNPLHSQNQRINPKLRNIFSIHILIYNNQKLKKRHYM